MVTAAEEATGKYSKEFNVVKAIAKKFALLDADVEVSAGGVKGFGFGVNPAGVITFNVSEEMLTLQENVYRDSGEEHAHAFADFFNNSLVAKSPQGNLVPLTDSPIAKADGNAVQFDLHKLKKLLNEHAIADHLPDNAKRYSQKHRAEKATEQAYQAVEQELFMRDQAERQEAMQDKILTAVEDVIADPDKLASYSPQMQANIQANLDNFASIAQQVSALPEALDQFREENPRIAKIVEKLQKQTQEQTANDDVTPEQSHADRIKQERQNPEKKAANGRG